MTTTFDTKAAQIQAIRNGDLEAIQQWMDERPQNEYAVEKLAVDVLLRRLRLMTDDEKKHKHMSREDAIAKLILCESAIRVIRASLRCPIGQAMVVAARETDIPNGGATAYADDAIDMLLEISNTTLNITGEDAAKFLAQMCEEREKFLKKKKPKPPPSSSY